MKSKLLRYLEIVVVIALLLLGAYARTYKINAPLADWHSWREADTAAVARNFVKDKFDLLYPQSDSLLALNEHNLSNPNRYFINEFPLYNGIVAVLYKQFGINTALGRLVSIIFATMGAAALYGLVRLTVGRGVAILSLLYYQFIPYNIYYSRVFMPDPTFVAFSILSLFLCALWVKTDKLRYGILLMFSFAIAMLVKPYAIFMIFPLGYWILSNWGWSAFKKRSIYLIVIGAFIPLALWRYHYSLHPEGTFASTWLLNGDGIRFKGAFFRWLIYDRLNRLIFATGGFALFIYGLFTSHLKKNTSLFFVWTLAIFLYMTIFAKGNVNHDYYQLPIVAPGSVLIAIAAVNLVKLGKNFLGKSINTLLVIALFALSFAFGWFEVRGYFNINNPAIVTAGNAVDELTPKDAIVIAPYQGDPAFLYQTNRHGWPIGGDIDTKIKLGSTYYVTTSKDAEEKDLANKYTVVKETDDYVIIKLQ